MSDQTEERGKFDGFAVEVGDGGVGDVVAVGAVAGAEDGGGEDEVCGVLHFFLV